MTAAQFDRLPDDGMKHELIAGELVTAPPPKFLHTRIQHRIADRVRSIVAERNLGETYFEAGFRLSLDYTVQPDVAFVRTAGLENVGADGYLHGAPALAVEVVSEWNTARDLERKVQRYLATGAEEVWVVYPDWHQIRVHFPDGSAVLAGDRLASRVFEGWSVRVPELFS